MKDMIGRLFSERKLMIEGKIDQDGLNRLFERILELQERSAKEPIVLGITSGGGSLRAAVKFYDQLQLLRVPIHGLAVGRCHSAAIAVLLGCGTRISMPSCHFLIHRVSLDIRISADESYRDTQERLQVLLRDQVRTEERFIDIHLKNSALDRETYDELAFRGQRFNVGLTAEEALKYGIIHEIVDEYKFF